MSDFLKHRYARLIISAGVVVFAIIFMVLTTPKPPTNGKPQTANSNVPQATANANTNTATNTNTAANTNKTKTTPKKSAPKPIGFTEKKTAHFVSANVMNNATLTQMPGTITITFNAPLTTSTQSFISVKKDDITSVTRTQSNVDSEHKILSVNLNQTVESGDYYVYYVACFADTGCKDGAFGFHLKLP
jgi:methionine-rich copper-binding protein CopC